MCLQALPQATLTLPPHSSWTLLTASYRMLWHLFLPTLSSPLHASLSGEKDRAGAHLAPVAAAAAAQQTPPRIRALLYPLPAGPCAP